MLKAPYILFSVIKSLKILSAFVSEMLSITFAKIPGMEKKIRFNSIREHAVRARPPMKLCNIFELPISLLESSLFRKKYICNEFWIS